jgi:hypothetical protein
MFLLAAAREFGCIPRRVLFLLFRLGSDETVDFRSSMASGGRLCAMASLSPIYVTSFRSFLDPFPVICLDAIQVGSFVFKKLGNFLIDLSLHNCRRWRISQRRS